MAENTTTYTAIIDTQVKGADEIEQLGEKADGAAAGFTKLQLQIRQTQKDLQAAAASGDKVKFNKLKAQLDDLEEGLENFAGCAVVISHDRWFLDRICTHILAFEGESEVYYFEGGFSDYEENKKKRLGGDLTPKRIKYRKLIRD